jgi:group I intron endonuclease
MPSSDIKKWTIYKITNPIGQVYVGCTSSFHRRYNDYKALTNSIKKQRLLYNSLIVYGVDKHSIEVIEEFENTHLYAQGKEIFWIRTNVCNYNKWPEYNGLNLTNGGAGNKGMVITTEAKLKISNAGKGRKLSKEHIESIRRANKGKRYTLGIKSTQKAITARREARNKMRRPIIIYDLSLNIVKEYISVHEASHDMNIDKKNIYSVLCGGQKQSKGFIFKYKI